MYRLCLLTLMFAVALCACSHPRVAAPAPVRPARPLLIKHGWDMPSIQFASENKTLLENAPFDGVMLTSDIMDRVFSDKSLTAQAARAALADYASITWSQPRHDFLLLFASHPRSSDHPPDWPANWSQIYENLATFSGAAREAGFYGIAFDNEPYGVNWFRWDITAGQPSRSILNHASQHGAACIRAIESAWSNAQVLVFLGPWVSVDQSGKLVGRWPMLAPFIGGFMGAAASARVIEGGQFYALKTAPDFLHMQTRLRHDYPALYGFLPDAFRSRIATHTPTAFGVYDRQFSAQSGGGEALSANDVSTRLTLALLASDSLVWFYTEAYDWWRSAPSSQLAAVPDEQRRALTDLHALRTHAP